MCDSVEDVEHIIVVCSNEKVLGPCMANEHSSANSASHRTGSYRNTDLMDEL